MSIEPIFTTASASAAIALFAALMLTAYSIVYVFILRLRLEAF